MANEIVLVEYDKACRQLARALAEATNVAELKKVHGDAGAIKAWAMLSKDKKAAAFAWKIRQEAERILGEKMVNGAEYRASVGKPKGPSQDPLPTLAEMGISKSLADRARRKAEISKKDWQLYLIDGCANVEHAVERAPQLKAKPKKKPKLQREFECPHCGKPVFLQGGRLEK